MLCISYTVANSMEIYILIASYILINTLCHCAYITMKPKELGLSQKWHIIKLCNRACKSWPCDITHLSLYISKLCFTTKYIFSLCQIPSILFIKLFNCSLFHIGDPWQIHYLWCTVSVNMCIYVYNVCTCACACVHV